MYMYNGWIIGLIKIFQKVEKENQLCYFTHIV